ncbi:MAG: peptidylprolyl isomerase, partial [Bacteroidota bacterium]|nr:peptidylprolyl isomerase [Bacteroidota bacterium]
AGMTVPVFDEAVYSLRPGEIYPRPVRTLFGYHIVKLLDRRPTRGEIEVSHILVRIPSDKPEDSLAAYAKIASILDTLRKGGDFAELARRNSEDAVSGERGGNLGWVGRRRFVPPFELAAFELPVGGTSGIVRTTFGYHIIKVTGERHAPPFEEARQELKQIYQRYGYEEDNRAFIRSIEEKHGMRIVDSTIERVAALIDTTATTAVGGWSSALTPEVLNLPLVEFRQGAMRVGEAVETIDRNRDLQSKPLNRSGLRDLAGILGQKEAFARETADLETRYPEFGELMKEYREGVLLFRAEQEAVWNRVTVRDSALRVYWEEHRGEFRWPDRVRFREIFVTSDSLGKVLRDSLNLGVDFGELASRHTQRAGYREKGGDWGLQGVSANELAQKAMTMQPGWIEGPFRHQYGWSIIRMEGREAAREKTFEEAQSEVSSKFQEYEHKRLEREWIDGLRKKFGVKINEEAVRRAFGKTGT